MIKPTYSTLILVEDDQHTASFSSLMSNTGSPVVTEYSNLKNVNGHASDLVAMHDVIIFETDPDNQAELSAVDAIVGSNDTNAIFIALTSEDVSITKARRLKARGVDEVLPKNIDAEDLKSIVEELHAARNVSQQTSSQSPAGTGKLIAVAQSAGGSGSTTLAVNIAAALAAKKGRFGKKSGARVAMVDLDVQFGSIGVLLDIEDNGGFLEMIESAAVPDANYLRGIMQTHESGVDVLVAPRQIAPITALDGNQFATLFDVLKANYDFVVVDLPRALVECFEPVVSRLDELLVVTDTSVPSMRQAKRLIDFYREDNITVTTRVVVSREAKPFMKSEQVREAEKLLETKFHHWLPDNAKVARKSADLGKPIVLSKPSSDIAKAYTALAKSLTQSADQIGISKE